MKAKPRLLIQSGDERKGPILVKWAEEAEFMGADPNGLIRGRRSEMVEQKGDGSERTEPSGSRFDGPAERRTIRVGRSEEGQADGVGPKRSAREY